MDHAQFEMQVAAILAAGAAGASGAKDPEMVVDLFVAIREELTRRSAISKQSANFIPKGR